MTMAAENTAGRAGDKEKEKVEKRRLWAEGWSRCLPGPRVVTAAPGQNSGTAGKQQVLTSFGMRNPWRERLSLRRLLWLTGHW